MSNVEFSSAETFLLADLQGVLEDLEAVTTLSEKFISIQDPPAPDVTLIREALCAAALIRYGRSFGQGVRTWDSSRALDGLSDRMKVEHEIFKGLRDKWIAHSVNAMEENRVMVILQPEEVGPKKALSVTVTSGRVIHLGSDEMKRLSDLAKGVRVQVLLQIEEEKVRVLTFIQSLPVDSLYERLGKPSAPFHKKHYSKNRKSR